MQLLLIAGRCYEGLKRSRRVVYTNGRFRGGYALREKSSGAEISGLLDR